MTPKEIYQTLSREIGKLVSYDRLAINLIQEDRNYIKVYAEESRLISAAIPQGAAAKEGTATGWVIDHQEPLICEDLLLDQRFPVTHQRYRDVGLRSYVILPLTAEGKALGALNLGSLKPACYGQKEVDILSPIAEILSLAVENSNLYEEAQGREETQRLLKELSQDITSLDVDSLLRKLTDKIREVLKVDVSDLRVFERDSWRLRGVSGINPNLIPSARTGTAFGRSRWIIEHRKPLLIRDAMEETDLPSGETVKSLGLRGYLGVPLFSKSGAVIGVLRVLTYQPRVFAQDEIDLLQQLANGAAIALENARLFEEVQQKSKDLESINLRLNRLLQQQSALREIFTQINLLDRGYLLHQLTEQALTLLHADHSIVRLLGPDGILRAVSLAGKGVERVGDRLDQFGKGRSTWIMENQRPLAIRDLNQDRLFGPAPLLREMGVQGYLGVPLISRGMKSIGVFTVSTLTEREFTGEEIALAQELAAGAAIAIENARLFEEARQKSLHLEALIKVNSDIASLLDRETLLPRIAEEARNILKVDSSIFRLTEGEYLVLLAASDPQSLSFRPKLRLGESLSGRIVQENRVVAIKNVLEEPTMIEEHREIARKAGYRSFLGVPLRLRGRTIGAINFYSKEERDFRPEEINFISAFADQAAIAIENARLFEEVQRKSAELEEALKAKSAFLNTMAHELKTPLNVIVGVQQLFLDRFYGELTEQQKKGLEPIGRNARDQLNLIDEILNLARLEVKRVPLKIEEFPIKKMIHELESSFIPLVREKGLCLRMEIEKGLESLRSDRSKLQNLLQNLLSNAVKYTDKGGVELRVTSVADLTSNGGRVSFSVRDTGTGIKETNLPHIFEAFYMAEGVDRKKYPGSGLGLTIVKRLVELLKGEIRVESEWGKGSTFTVALPVTHTGNV